MQVPDGYGAALGANFHCSSAAAASRSKRLPGNCSETQMSVTDPSRSTVKFMHTKPSVPRRDAEGGNFGSTRTLGADAEFRDPSASGQRGGCGSDGGSKFAHAAASTSA